MYFQILYPLKGEKMLILVKQRPGHRCPTAIVTVGIAVWDGIPAELASEAYENIVEFIPGGAMPSVVSFKQFKLFFSSIDKITSGRF